MVSPGLCIIVKNFPIASPKIGQVHGENNHNTAFIHLQELILILWGRALPGSHPDDLSCD